MPRLESPVDAEDQLQSEAAVREPTPSTILEDAPAKASVEESPAAKAGERATKAGKGSSTRGKKASKMGEGRRVSARQLSIQKAAAASSPKKTHLRGVLSTAAKPTKVTKARSSSKKSKSGTSVVPKAKKNGTKTPVAASKTRKGKAPEPKKVFNKELKSAALEWEVEVIRDSKINKKGERKYLVKWVGFPESENTWEPEVNLNNSTDKIAEYDEANPDKP